MFNPCFVKKSRTVPYSKEAVLKVLWDINHLAEYELKVDRVKVEKLDDKQGFYKPVGHFAGLPWKGKFSYKKNPNGFRSRLLKGPLGKRLKVSGGFLVKQKTPSKTIITHDEKYQFSGPLKLIHPLLKFYIAWSIDEELKIIEDICKRESAKTN